jgi:hypothetical protein
LGKFGVRKIVATVRTQSQAGRLGLGVSDSEEAVAVFFPELSTRAHARARARADLRLADRDRDRRQPHRSARSLLVKVPARAAGPAAAARLAWSGGLTRDGPSQPTRNLASR